jgi:type VI secretion system protein VasJ
MLGIRKPAAGWNWAASGKHPSAKDFFHIGCRFPLAAGLADWVRKGFSPPGTGSRMAPGGCSWRFWAQGNSGKELACGLLRDSSDSLGRPYPLLIAGSGVLPAWQDHWEWLSRACDGAWRQMEYVSSRKYDNLEQLEGELLRTRPPGPDWAEIKTMAPAGSDSFRPPLPPLVVRMDNGIVRLSLEDLATGGGNGEPDPIPDLVLQVNAAVKAAFDKTPSAMFMGGTVDRSFVVFFFRAIKAADFAMLWSPDNGNN